MRDSVPAELCQLVGQHTKLVYEAVKAGMVSDLSAENRPLARAISEHMHLKHVHNALEFADVREGETYEIAVDGHVVSPMAHIAMHSAVKGQVGADPRVAAAFEKLVVTGAGTHQAEHILAVLFSELYFHLVQVSKDETYYEKARAAYYRKIKKVTQDAAYRKKLKRQVPADHHGFE
jgi:hypothetical protein